MGQVLLPRTGERIGTNTRAAGGFKVGGSVGAIVGVHVVVQFLLRRLDKNDLRQRRLLVGDPAVAVVVKIRAPAVLAKPCARSRRTAGGAEVGHGKGVVPADDGHHMVDGCQLGCLVIGVRGRVIAALTGTTTGIVVVGRRQSAAIHQFLLDGRDSRTHGRLIGFVALIGLAALGKGLFVDDLCVQKAHIRIEPLALRAVHLCERIGVEGQYPWIFGLLTQSHAVEDRVRHIAPAAAVFKGALVVDAVLVKGTASVCDPLTQGKIDRMRFGEVGRVLLSEAV